MRIISGKFRGRRFYPPADKWPTRPTTDIAREGLYNILQNRLDFSAISMLDLFGGTGSHSLECISLGCTNVTYVEKFPACMKFVREIVDKLDVSDLINIYHDDVFRFCRRTDRQFDYIFAGPPYALKEISIFHDFLFGCNILIKGGLFVLETDQHYDFSGHSRFLEVRNYGQSHFHFFT